MVTLGMSYEVIPGREEQFERVFEGVVDKLEHVDGHVRTRLYRACDRGSEGPPDYMILSEWRDRASFDGFVGSSVFARVTAWGGREILRGRPVHEIYEHGASSGAHPDEMAACPVAHAS
jgi:heme-degrading monooxygenase HmoA